MDIDQQFDELANTQASESNAVRELRTQAQVAFRKHVQLSSLDRPAKLQSVIDAMGSEFGNHVDTIANIMNGAPLLYDRSVELLVTTMHTYCPVCIKPLYEHESTDKFIMMCPSHVISQRCLQSSNYDGHCLYWFCRWPPVNRGFEDRGAQNLRMEILKWENNTMNKKSHDDAVNLLKTAHITYDRDIAAVDKLTAVVIMNEIIGKAVRSDQLVVISPEIIHEICVGAPLIHRHLDNLVRKLNEKCAFCGLEIATHLDSDVFVQLCPVPHITTMRCIETVATEEEEKQQHYSYTGTCPVCQKWNVRDLTMWSLSRSQQAGKENTELNLHMLDMLQKMEEQKIKAENGTDTSR